MNEEDTKKLLEALTFLANEFKQTTHRAWRIKSIEEKFETPINELYDKYCLNDVDKTEKQ